MRYPLVLGAVLVIYLVLDVVVENVRGLAVHRICELAVDRMTIVVLQLYCLRILPKHILEA